MAAQEAIEEVFGRQRIPESGVRVLQGQYSIAQLKQWYDPMYMSVLTIPGVTATDLLEGRNRLWIGVENMDLQWKVEEELGSLDIPREAVIIEKFEYFVEDSHTIREDVRPVDAGAQIENSERNVYCTLGFVTFRDDEELGIVTAHHCGTDRAAVDGDNYHQPEEDGDDNLIGEETIDPAFFTGGTCPVGKECRYSQGSFVSDDETLELNQGYIARTTGMDDSSLTVDHDDPNFRIKSEGFAVTEDTVHKVGRTTGWTSGEVDQTCANIPLASTDYVYLCQDVADYDRGLGDSGAPVFVRDESDPDDVHIVGMHWGRHPDDLSLRVYSPIGNIYLDLGMHDTWDTCAPEFYC